MAACWYLGGGGEGGKTPEAYEVDFVSKMGCAEAVRVRALVGVHGCVLWGLGCEVSH